MTAAASVPAAGWVFRSNPTAPKRASQILVNTLRLLVSPPLLKDELPRSESTPTSPPEWPSELERESSTRCWC